MSTDGQTHNIMRPLNDCGSIKSRNRNIVSWIQSGIGYDLIRDI
jgi:hypothetical protein